MAGEVLVIGAGIGGLTTGIALRRAGWDVTVFEQAPSLRAIQAGGGIHLWHNAMRVLTDLGIGEQVRAVGWRQRVAEFCSWRGEVLASWPIATHEDRLGVPTLGVSRADLQPVLVEALTALDGELRLHLCCERVRDDGSQVIASFADGTQERGSLLVGADGLNSTVRAGLLAEEAPRYAGYTIWQAITDFPHDRVPAGTFRVLYGRGSRFAYYHVGGGRLYWFGLTNAPARERDPEHGPRDRLRALFAGWAPPVEAIVEATSATSIQRQDIRDRKPIRRWGRGRVTLLGDAAHPIRRIAASRYGPADAPVSMLYFHATTSSRLEGRIFDAAARRQGVRVVALDRPGAGQSDPKPGRRLLDWPDDVADVADELGVDRFASVGQSAGAPHALACAHALPDRVSVAVPVNSLIPVLWQPALAVDALPSERFPLLTGRATPVLRLLLRVWGLLLRPRTLTPGRFARLLRLPPEDRRLLENSELWMLVCEAIREGTRQDRQIAMREMSSLYAPAGWGFDPYSLKVPVVPFLGEKVGGVEFARRIVAGSPAAESHLERFPGGHMGSAAQEVGERIVALVARSGKG
jgi:2-polyprenyl-6-methoxyphenol hydroxylase-like FAD-dependent oxidoreductase